MPRLAVTDNSPLVLIVDKDVDTLDMYGEFLEYSGFRVAQAQSTDDALEKARTLRPSIIHRDALKTNEEGSISSDGSRATLPLGRFRCRPYLRWARRSGPRTTRRL